MKTIILLFNNYPIGYRQFFLVNFFLFNFFLYVIKKDKIYKKSMLRNNKNWKKKVTNYI